MILAALLLTLSGAWAWDATPGDVAGYLLCWSRGAAIGWSLSACVDVGDVLLYDDAELRALWGFHGRHRQTLFFQVVAYNTAGYIGAAEPPIEPRIFGMCP